ncbi:hypothetical protein HT031_004982 [Scenedesmus sp. PABB004]|nr:hypothetical protein HT031_004982 [Scenedesmus sp. PABB004]
MMPCALGAPALPTACKAEGPQRRSGGHVTPYAPYAVTHHPSGAAATTPETLRRCSPATLLHAALRLASQSLAAAMTDISAAAAAFEGDAAAELHAALARAEGHMAQALRRAQLALELAPYLADDDEEPAALDVAGALAQQRQHAALQREMNGQLVLLLAHQAHLRRLQHRAGAGGGCPGDDDGEEVCSSYTGPSVGCGA